MEVLVRRNTSIELTLDSSVEQPHGRVRRVTVQPRGQAPIDALVGRPADPRGVTLHFVGFNTTLGPWEAAKCALWAAASQTIVVMCELPGFSRHGDPLTEQIRHDLLADDPMSWALATLACLKEAMEVSDVPEPEQVDVLGYSTGCSLAVAALPAIQASYPVSNLTLVEPVSVSQRTLGWLTLHNVVDLARLVQTIPANAANAWIRQAALRQINEPLVHFTLPDFLALITLLASRDIPDRLDRLELPTTHLARGILSQLSPAEGFTALDDQLVQRLIPGTTCVVDGFGHQLWHSLPAIDALARALHSQPDDQRLITAG